MLGDSYKGIVRFHLDYVSTFSVHKALDSIQNKTLRIATGTMKTKLWICNGFDVHFFSLLKETAIPMKFLYKLK